MTALFITLPIILIGVAAALLVALLFVGSVPLLRVVKAILGTWCGITIVLLAVWSWCLRDLFESFAVPSHGDIARDRFLELFWLPLVLTVIMLLSGFFYRRRTYGLQLH